MKTKVIALISIGLFLSLKSISSKHNIIQYNDSEERIIIGKSLYILEDKENTLSFTEVVNSVKFTKSETAVPNFGVSPSVYWIKFSLNNTSSEKQLLVELAQPIMDEVEFYYQKENNNYQVEKIGEIVPFGERKYNYTNYVFDLYIDQNETKTYYFKLKSSEQIQAPIYIGNINTISEASITNTLISALFFGIMIVMVFYNLFVYFTVKDRSYLIYVIYIFILALTQICPKGFTFQYFWPNSSWLAVHSMFLLPALVGAAGVLFFKSFLKAKEFVPLHNKIFNIQLLVYAVVIALTILKYYKISYSILELNAMGVSFFMLYSAATILKKGFKPAKYFLFAWSIFLIGIFLWVMKDIGILPYNNFTNFTMQAGAAIETVLLSFALAARINVYKKERLEALREKERIVREQNIVLEKNVQERTKELKEALNYLKQTQSQLVDSEKMSSLGQLTAGIAHEINNPINFVSSNISPLRQDLEDINTILQKYEELESAENVKEKVKEIHQLKQELDFDYLQIELNTIISGIEDGAERTKEIVSSLKNFSRLDEGELQKANLNEGIESTLVLLKNKLGNIVLEKKLGSLPNIECYPGKLNQVFMNMIDNAIGAVEQRENGYIKINTYHDEQYVYISIADNGHGIDETIKEKIFDPFFTTKDVGKGTGLGLSITYRIIENHNGEIIVNSKINEGTEMLIKLPIKK